MKLLQKNVAVENSSKKCFSLKVQTVCGRVFIYKMKDEKDSQDSKKKESEGLR